MWKKRRFLAINVAMSSWGKTKELRKGSFLQSSMCSMTTSMNSQIGLWEDGKETEMTRKSNIRLASNSTLNNKFILLCKEDRDKDKDKEPMKLTWFNLSLPHYHIYWFRGHSSSKLKKMNGNSISSVWRAASLKTISWM